MNILHLQLTGNPGGVVVLCRDIANNSQNRNFMYFLFSGGMVADEMKKDGINVTVANADRYKWKRSKKELIEFCRENKIDVILNHTNSPIAIAHTLAVKKALHDTKIVMYLHSAAEDGLGKKKKRLINWPFIYAIRKKADVIIAISEYVKNSYLKVWGNESKIKVVYNGVDPHKFIPHEDYFKHQVMELLYVGRLFDNKGINLLIEALGLLDKAIPIHLSIVGDGPGKSNYEQMAEELKLGSKVDFWGSRSDVPNFLSKANFFIHPAVWNEGFGITLAESLTAGVPCVAYRRGAIPEIISDGNNGFIVDDVSSAALSRKISDCYEIMKNEETYMQMVRNAKLSAEKFEITKMVSSIEGLLNGLYH